MTVVSASSPDGDVVINDDGTLTFTPNPDFVGEAQVNYTVSDGELSDPAVLFVNVTDPAVTPVTVDDVAETPEDTPITIDVLVNDIDPNGDTLEVKEATSPDGAVEINDDGTIEFTPSENFNGPTTITYVICDPDGNESTATVDLTVTPVNDAPVVTDEAVVTPLNTPITIHVLANDTDPDSDPLVVHSATSENGEVVINDDGTITFTADDGFTGDAGIIYTVSDGNGGETDGNATVTVPCFTPSTMIATPKGERKVEELEVGDRIITRDNGMQEVRWIGCREMPGEELAAKEHLRPVLIQQGALGNGLPERDMMVSPQHRVLVANDKTALYFEEREVLVAAKHLTDMDGIDVVDVSHTTYIHIMFDRHEVVLSDGTWSESFQPGDMSMAGVGDASSEEILELFPELATGEGIEAYAAARKSLKKHEAKLITKKS